MDDFPRIASVIPLGSTRLALVWRNGERSTVDLARWLSRPNLVLGTLSDPAVFARAAVGGYGSMVTWDDDRGDLAIDAVHLKMMADDQAVRESAAASEVPATKRSRKARH